MIRQKLFGSTESRDEPKTALSAYDLDDTERSNPRDVRNSEFRDYYQAIELAILN